MATQTENFLVNPPKHAPKKKMSEFTKAMLAATRGKRGIHFKKAKAVKPKSKITTWHTPGKSLLGAEGSLHRPRVYTMGGHWQTSTAAKVARPGMRLNPFKKNPMGEELMFIGANPFREVKKMATHKKHGTKKHHKKASGKKHHKKHFGFRSNPVMDGSMVKPVLYGLGGGVALMVIPALLEKIKAGLSQGWMGTLAKVGIIGGAAYGISKAAGKQAATGFGIGAATVLGTELLAPMVSSVIAPAPVTAYGPALPAPATTGAAGFETLSGFEEESLNGTNFSSNVYANPFA